MATELGQAYVQIIPSAKGIQGSIQRQLDPEANSAGQSAGLKIGAGLKAAAVAAVATAGVAIGKTVSMAISEGANLQQSLGGIETLFKGSADKVKQYASDAYKTAGLSANSYMENVTSFSASLLQSMGGNTEKAADTANMAMIDMSDNANKMGTNMGDIQNAYQGFAKQNYTMLDNLKLGYGGTKEEMQRLLADAQKLTGVKYDISNLGDVYNAIHAVQQELGITGTTAKESAETFSGSLDSMKAAYSNVLGNIALGHDIGPSLNALAETVATFLFGNFFPMVGNILSALPGAIVTFIQAAAPRFLEAGSQMLSQISGGFTTGMPNFMTSLQEIITGFTTWVTANLPTFLNTGIQFLVNIINGILQYLPQLITVAGELISTFISFLMTNLPVILGAGKDLLLKLVDGIISNLPAIGESAIQAISKFIDTILANYPKYLDSGQKILKSLIQGILDRLPDLISAASELILKFAAMLISKLPDILAVGVEILLNLMSGILQKISDLSGVASKIGGILLDKLSNINLFSAGSAIINGFLNGLKSKFESVKSFVGGIAKWIKDHKGPISYDRRLLIPAGNSIMAGLHKGLEDSFPDVQRDIKTINDMLAGVNGNATFSAQTLGAIDAGTNGSSSETQPTEIHLHLNVYGDLPDAMVHNLSKKMVVKIQDLMQRDKAAVGGTFNV